MDSHILQIIPADGWWWEDRGDPSFYLHYRCLALALIATEDGNGEVAGIVKALGGSQIVDADDLVHESMLDCIDEQPCEHYRVSK